MAHKPIPSTAEPIVINYENLFRVTLVIIPLLGGSIWGLWNSQYRDNLANIQHIDSKQWELLKELSDQHVRHEADTEYLKREVERLRKDADDQEVRLRAEEHRSSK